MVWGKESEEFMSGNLYWFDSSVASSVTWIISARSWDWSLVLEEKIPQGAFDMFKKKKKNEGKKRLKIYGISRTTEIKL